MDGSFSSQFSQTATDTDRGVTERFRREVDRFLAEELTPELRDAGRATTGLKSPSWACKEWRQKLFDKGWLAPSWPKMHGGAG